MEFVEGFLMFFIMYYRVCIYTKEVAFITGKGDRYARDVIRDIKLLHKKEKHQLVTIREVCDYLGLSYDEIFLMINPRT